MFYLIQTSSLSYVGSQCKLALSHAEIMQISKEIIVFKNILNKHPKTLGYNFIRVFGHFSIVVGHI